METMVQTNAEKVALAKNEKSDRETLVAPNVDIYESAREIRLEADFPGVARDALSIELDGRELTLEGRRPYRTGTLRLRRTFRLPDTIDPARVEAELRHGVLRVTLPKRDEVLPRRIEIRAAG